MWAEVGLQPMRSDVSSSVGRSRLDTSGEIVPVVLRRPSVVSVSSSCTDHLSETMAFLPSGWSRDSGEGSNEGSRFSIDVGDE